jgi:hypothetical protein
VPSDRRREVLPIHPVALARHTVRNASGTVSLLPWERMMTSLFVYGIQGGLGLASSEHFENPESQAQQRLR